MRVVKDLQPINTGGIGSITDSYWRPVSNKGSSLMSIANAIQKWNPLFLNLYEQKAQQTYNKQVAEGKALVQELESQGYDVGDLRMKDFHQLVAEGKSARLAKLSKFHEHGINVIQMETAAKGLEGAADKWFEEGTFTDADGVERHVYEMDNPLDFERAFRNFSAQRFQEITGGKYDALLYQDKYLSIAESVRKKLETRYFDSKAKVKRLETERTVTANLDAGIVKSLYDGTFMDNPDFSAQLAAEMQRAYDVAARLSTPKEAAEMIKDWVIPLMVNSTTSQINSVMSAIAAVPDVYGISDYRKAIKEAAQRQNFFFERQIKEKAAADDRAQRRAEREFDKAVVNQYLSAGLTFDTEEGRRLVEKALETTDRPDLVYKAARMNTLYKHKANASAALEREQVRQTKELRRHVEPLIKRDSEITGVLKNLKYLKPSGFENQLFVEGEHSSTVSYLSQAYEEMQLEKIYSIGRDKFLSTNPVEYQQAVTELNAARHAFLLSEANLAAGTPLSEQAEETTKAVIESIVSKQRAKSLGIQSSSGQWRSGALKIKGYWNSGLMEHVASSPHAAEYLDDFMKLLKDNSEYYTLTLQQMADKGYYTKNLNTARNALRNNPIVYKDIRISSPDELWNHVRIYTDKTIE